MHMVHRVILSFTLFRSYLHANNCGIFSSWTTSIFISWLFYKFLNYASYPYIAFKFSSSMSNLKLHFSCNLKYFQIKYKRQVLSVMWQIHCFRLPILYNIRYHDWQETYKIEESQRTASFQIQITLNTADFWGK